MPTYEYECTNCEHTLDAFQSMTADRLVTCPECQTDSLKRLIGTGAGIIFKGSGFYETDYKRKNGKPSENRSSDKQTKSKNKKDVAATPTPKKTT